MTIPFHFSKGAFFAILGLILAGWFAVAGCRGRGGDTATIPDDEDDPSPAPVEKPFSSPSDSRETLLAPLFPPRTARGPDTPRNSGIIMAFGDSLTAGGSGPTYPEILAGLTGKTVTNDGSPGTTAESGVVRAPTVIARRNGSCMLILYGINDLLFGHSPRQIAASIDCMVHVCEAWRVTPVLATYPLPIRRHAAFARATADLNSSIRRLASARGIPLVDLEKAFMVAGQPDPDLYLEDGLHPSPRGNSRIARAFATLF